MSGGHFEYSQYRINDIAEELERLIESNDDKTPHEYGGTIGRGYSSNTIARFKVGLIKLREAQVYAQRIDWLLSGDDGEETFHERLLEDLENLR